MQWFKFAFSCRLTNDVKQNEMFWHIFKWVCISQNSETVEGLKDDHLGREGVWHTCPCGAPRTTPACSSGGEHYKVITGPGLSLWIFSRTIHHTVISAQTEETHQRNLTDQTKFIKNGKAGIVETATEDGPGFNFGSAVHHGRRTGPHSWYWLPQVVWSAL